MNVNFPPHPNPTPTSSVTSSAVTWTLTSHPTPPQPMFAKNKHIPRGHTLGVSKNYQTPSAGRSRSCALNSIVFHFLRTLLETDVNSCGRMSLLRECKPTRQGFPWEDSADIGKLEWIRTDQVGFRRTDRSVQPWLRTFAWFYSIKNLVLWRVLLAGMVQQWRGPGGAQKETFCFCRVFLTFAHKQRDEIPTCATCRHARNR